MPPPHFCAKQIKVLEPSILYITVTSIPLNMPLLLDWLLCPNHRKDETMGHEKRLKIMPQILLKPKSILDTVFCHPKVPYF